MSISVGFQSAVFASFSSLSLRPLAIEVISPLFLPDSDLASRISPTWSFLLANLYFERCSSIGIIFSGIIWNF
ncbi:hypothetical protein B296_00010812 [Ensete ventricosum]|uniref:Uncharacterized protein n=1 Tax=Ensete ventricosum TaxID=4639 RepID=A0A426ZMG9_ENSVE|nr:hypothetical protein B296_00010812 [Ensete ventricosum]